MHTNWSSQSKANLGELITLSSGMNAECRYDEADALVLEAYESRGKPPAALAHYLRLARDRSDWFSVVDRALQMRQRLPDNPAGYLKGLEAHRTLRQFDAARLLLNEALERFSSGALLLEEEALLAESRGDWKTVDTQMAALREARPSEPDSWIQSVRSLIRSARGAAAEALLHQALSIFKDNPELNELYATVAESRRQWDEADRRWGILTERFSSHVGIAFGHALSWTRGPLTIRNWPETFARLEQLQRRFPDSDRGYEVHMRLMRERGRLADAEMLAQQASGLFPLQPMIAVERSRIANAQTRPEEALAILADALNKMPFSPAVHAELAETLNDAGWRDEAESVCREACNRFRFHPKPFVVFAEIAMERGDVETGFARWADGARRFPQHDFFAGRMTAAQFNLIASGLSDPTIDRLPVTDLDRGSSLRGLLLGFESLGGPGFGCELGDVQRRAGAHPLGLLRWGETSVASLAEAFATRFEGVGDPEQTDIVLREDIEDYTIVDRRFDISMHSFTRYKTMPFDLLMEDTCRRLAYLKTKLLRDLEAGKKIFVYRLGNRAIDLQEIDHLHSRFRSLSDGTLLCIASARVDSPDLGTVKVIKERLLLGYLEAITEWGLTNHAMWHEVCWRARELTSNGQ